MKTKSLIIAIVALFAVTAANAKSTKKELISKVQKEMTYPKLAIEEGLEGDVLVEFKVDDEGKIQVCQANASNHDLKQLVVQKMESISPAKLGVAPNEMYQLKFSFKLK